MPARRPTVRETEIKLRVADLPGLIRKIFGLGARCRGRVLERNTLFDTPDGDFRGRGRLLRIRLEDPAPSVLLPGGRRRAWITSKIPAAESARSRYKEKLERESVLPLSGELATRLRSLGFRTGFRYEKFRTTFVLAGLHLDLDETPVGIFLELEGHRAAIDRVARALGYSRRDYIRGTYWDLYAAECRRLGRNPRNMTFSS
jgi:adenylate cyclase, class 2